MRVFLRSNGLTIALMAMFLFSVVGMILAGHASHNEELTNHSAPAIDLLSYLGSGAFLSALFENWESEFLQMAVYVTLTAVLFQRGSAESRDPDNPDRPNDRLPDELRRRHPILSWLYSNALGLALAALFVMSFSLHWWSSFVATNQEAARHGGELRTFGAYFFDAQLWFESFQNWQSEFLSTAVLVVLSIFLRHQGSPESKPVGASNAETGD